MLAAKNRINVHLGFFRIRDKVVARAKAEAVCPEGKE